MCRSRWKRWNAESGLSSSAAETPSGMTIADLASELGVARAICYRLVATLEFAGHADSWGRRQGVSRTSLPALAAKYHPALIELATPMLQALADSTGATAFLTVAIEDEAMVMLSLEPAAASLGPHRLGNRHPLDRGAPGIAILSGRPESFDGAALKYARPARRGTA